MAQPVFSTALLTGDGVSGATAAVPAGFVWVVREISLYFGGVLGSDCEVLELASGVVLLDKGAPSGSPLSYHEDRHIVIAAGGGRGLQFASADTWDVWISGYQLTLP